MSEKIEPPVRAHHLRLDIGADTRADLVGALKNLAMRIDRDELSTGCSGGSDWGGTYVYRHDANITHDSYFAAVDEYLAAKEEAA